MRRQKHELSDHQAGRLDGFDGREPRGDSPEYRAGYAEGEQQRREAHERMAAACRRFTQYTPSEN